MEIKEFMNACYDKIVFNEQGVIFRKGKYENGQYSINHCFCPYGSIKKISLLMGVVNITFVVDGIQRCVGYISYNDAQKRELKDVIHFAKSQIKKVDFTNGIIYKDEEPTYDINLNDLEIRKRCNVCGHVFCYNKDDIEKNRQRIKDARLSAFASLAGAYSGNYAASAVNAQSTNNQLNSIIDYSVCPNCNSRDIVEISDEEFKPVSQESNTTKSTLSGVEEIKKFKELLDMGIISEEEFNTKKKELLGL